jgi:SHAQKYF class myb-like DNA-binding protein
MPLREEESRAPDKDMPLEKEGIHLLDLEYWPALDIGNELLHVDWLDGEGQLKAHERYDELGQHGSSAGTRHKESAHGADGIAPDDGTFSGPPGMGDMALNDIDVDLDFPGGDGTGVWDDTKDRDFDDGGDNETTTKSGSASKGRGKSARDKRRLRWTPELHSLFVEAVQFLNGPDKATPKGIMKYMKVEGLTIFHIKSHLQKFRLNYSHSKGDSPKNTTTRKKQKKSASIGSMDSLSASAKSDVDHHSRIEQALQVQMQMQKKLQEQLEEQRKLQLSMQAQEQHIRQLKEELEKSKAEDRATTP